jgi:hypothetical protein
MRKTDLLRAIFLSAAMMTSCVATSHPELMTVCNSIYRVLNDVPGATVAMHINKSPNMNPSCTILLKGASTNSWPPNGAADTLFPGETSEPYEEGWRFASYQADGPDGMAYDMVKGSVLCDVQGSWDGGQDDNPSYVPSPLYETVVRCSVGK